MQPISTELVRSSFDVMEHALYTIVNILTGTASVKVLITYTNDC